MSKLLLLSAAVVASEKGVVVGRLTFREDGDLIDCRRMGVGGKAIPPNIDKVMMQPLVKLRNLVLPSCTTLNHVSSYQHCRE